MVYRTLIPLVILVCLHTIPTCCMDEHKDPMPPHSHYDPSTEYRIDELTPLIRKLYRSVNPEKLPVPRWLIRDRFLAEALYKINRLRKQPTTQVPTQLIAIITKLLDNQSRIDMESSILTLALILTKHEDLLHMKDPNGKTMHDLMNDYFEKLYNIEARTSPYTIPERNNYLGTWLVLQTALETIMQEKSNQEILSLCQESDKEMQPTMNLSGRLMLFSMAQSLYELIRLYAQNPEMLIHFIRYLLDHGSAPDELRTFFSDRFIRIDEARDDGVTALMLAAYNDFYDICSCLIAINAPINRSDSIARNTALHYAVERGNADIVQLLCERGAENLPNTNKLPPSTRILQQGNKTPIRKNINMLEHVLKNSEIGECIIKDSETGESVDISNEQYLYVSALLLPHAIPPLATEILAYICDAFNPITRLTYAAHHGYHPIIRFLKKAYVNINQPDQYGLLSISYAASNGQAETVDLLLSFGALDIPDRYGNMPSNHIKNNTSEVEDNQINGIILTPFKPVQEDSKEPAYYKNMHILWSLLSSNLHPQQQCSDLHHDLYWHLMDIIRRHVSWAPAALILNYSNPTLDINLRPELGMYLKESDFYIHSRFMICGPFAQNPYQIYEGIQQLTSPEDQSTTVLNALGNWIKIMTNQMNPKSIMNIRDTDGTTLFDIAMRNGSWPMAHILKVAGSYTDDIKALRTMLELIKHNTITKLTQQKLLETIMFLPQSTPKSERREHNKALAPFVDTLKPLIRGDNQQPSQVLSDHIDQLDHDLATTLEVRKAIPVLNFATPLLALIMSYLMQPIHRTNCS